MPLVVDWLLCAEDGVVWLVAVCLLPWGVNGAIDIWGAAAAAADAAAAAAADAAARPDAPLL